MATSADKDDRDEDEKDAAEGDEAEAEEKEPAEDEADEGDDEEEEEEEAKPAAKPAASAKAPAKGAAPAKPAAKAPAKGAPRPGVKRAPGPGARPVKGKAPPPRKGGSLSKTMILFVLIVGGLTAAFALLSGGANDNSPPKWKVGDTVQLDITLVPSDSRNLACSAPDEIAGRHCAFEAGGKAWSKGDSNDDKTLLRPYTTTNGIQFYAAGVWSDPALAPTALPKDDARFTAHCNYKVEGAIKKGQVRWNVSGQWLDWPEHYTGSISGCKLIPP